MRTVFVYLDADEIERLEGVKGEGLTRYRCDPEHGRVLLYLTRGADEDAQAADLSYMVTRMASREWLYVGAIVGAA